MTTPIPELGTEPGTTEPDTTEPGSTEIRTTPRLPDPELAEDYAEAVGIDPTPEQIDRYLQLEGDEPLGELRELDDGALIEEAGRAEA